MDPVTTSSGAPRFSVIVPTFNRAETVVATVAALRHQTFADFEVLVVDDGSTDDTANAVKGVDHLRLTYEWQPNAGPSVARNRGAELATGEYLAFLDTGDVVHPDWLATFDTMIRAYGSEIVSCGAEFTRDDSVLKSRPTAPTRPGRRAGDRLLSRRVLHGSPRSLPRPSVASTRCCGSARCPSSGCGSGSRYRARPMR